jgi:hypothetical protein
MHHVDRGSPSPSPITATTQSPKTAEADPKGRQNPTDPDAIPKTTQLQFKLINHLTPPPFFSIASWGFPRSERSFVFVSKNLRMVEKKNLKKMQLELDFCLFFFL